MVVVAISSAAGRPAGTLIGRPAGWHLERPAGRLAILAGRPCSSSRSSRSGSSGSSSSGSDFFRGRPAGWHLDRPAGRLAPGAAGRPAGHIGRPAGHVLVVVVVVAISSAAGRLAGTLIGRPAGWLDRGSWPAGRLDRGSWPAGRPASWTVVLGRPAGRPAGWLADREIAGRDKLAMKEWKKMGMNHEIGEGLLELFLWKAVALEK